LHSRNAPRKTSVVSSIVLNSDHPLFPGQLENVSSEKCALN
jgi:hypothetical protein